MSANEVIALLPSPMTFEVLKRFNFFLAKKQKLLDGYRRRITNDKLSRKAQLRIIGNHFRQFPEIPKGKSIGGWQGEGVYSNEWMKHRIILSVTIGSFPLDNNSLTVFARHAAYKKIYLELVSRTSIIEFYEEMRDHFQNNISLIARQHAANFETNVNSNRSQIQRYLRSHKKKELT